MALASAASYGRGVVRALVLVLERFEALLPLTLALCVMGSAVPLRAHAQDTPEAEPAAYRATIAQALAEYEAGHFEESHSLMAQAHAIFPSARTLRGLGMTAFELRNYAESAERLGEALRSTIRPLEGELRAQTEALLERARSFLFTVPIELYPSDALLTVDGAPAALSHGCLTLGVGAHRIEASAPGYASQGIEVQIVEQHKQAIRIQLLPLSTPPSGHEDQSNSKRWYKSPWLWASVGALVATSAATLTWIALSDEPAAAEPYTGLVGDSPLKGPSQP